MRRRREHRSARTAAIASPKVSNKLTKAKQQPGLTNGKSENDESSEQPILATGGYSTKKGN